MLFCSMCVCRRGSIIHRNALVSHGRGSGFRATVRILICLCRLSYVKPTICTLITGQVVVSVGGSTYVRSVKSCSWAVPIELLAYHLNGLVSLRHHSRLRRDDLPYITHRKSTQAKPDLVGVLP